MKRQTYRPSELRAGMTVFVGGVDMMAPMPRPYLGEFLIAGRKDDRWPEPNEQIPYRIGPRLLNAMAGMFPLYRTRRAAAQAAVAATNAERDCRMRRGSSPTP